MRQIYVQVMGMAELSRRLGKMAPEARRVMRMSVNDTASKARSKLNKKAQSTYVVKKTKFNKGMTLKRATDSTLTATITSRGNPLPLGYFKIRKQGKIKAGQGHQLQSSHLTPIRKNENKTFIPGLGSGHRSLFYRVTEKRYPIHQVYGSSIPAMLGGKRVLREVRPEIETDLRTNLERHIDLVLRRL